MPQRGLNEATCPPSYDGRFVLAATKFKYKGYHDCGCKIYIFHNRTTTTDLLIDASRSELAPARTSLEHPIILAHSGTQKFTIDQRNKRAPVLEQISCYSVAAVVSFKDAFVYFAVLGLLSDPHSPVSTIGHPHCDPPYTSDTGHCFCHSGGTTFVYLTRPLGLGRWAYY